jgi:hypothetical protein
VETWGLVDVVSEDLSCSLKIRTPGTTIANLSTWFYMLVKTTTGFEAQELGVGITLSPLTMDHHGTCYYILRLFRFGEDGES